MRLEIGILGILEVRVDGREIPLRSARQRALLGLLVLHAGEVVSRDHLEDALWGQSPPPTATKALQVHVSQLRKACLTIDARAPGYVLHVEPGAVDADRFERLAATGARALAAGDAPRAAETLREALALWRGPPLADLAYADFAQPEIARLEELRLQAIEDRVDAELALGSDDLVGELEALVAGHPYRERLRRQLMLALYRSGRQAEALATYRATQRVLDEELGLQPTRELTDLERAILRHDPGLSAGPSRGVVAAAEFADRCGELAAQLEQLADADLGDGALDDVGWAEAAHLHGLALTVLERAAPGDTGRRTALLLRRGAALARAGDDSGARECFLAAARLAARAGMPEVLAEAALAYLGRFLWMRSIADPQLVPLIEQALDALGEGDHPLRARLLARLVPALRGGELGWEERRLLGDEAVAMARRVGDPETLAYTIESQISGLCGPFMLDRVMPGAEELIELGTELGDDERVFGGLEQRMWNAWLLGDMPGVRAGLAAITRLAGELHQPAQRWVVLVANATLATFEGRFAAAELLIDEAFAAGEHALSWAPAIERDLQRFHLRFEQGRLAELDDVLPRWRRERPGYRILDCLALAVDLEVGRLERATDRLGAIAADGFAGLSPDEQWVWGATFAAEACVRLGDRERGAELYTRLLPVGPFVVVTEPEVACGSTWRWLGMLAALCERWDVADEHFSAALALDESTGARPAATHDREEQARALLRRGRGRDRARAEVLLARAAHDRVALSVAH